MMLLPLFCDVLFLALAWTMRMLTQFSNWGHYNSGDGCHDEKKRYRISSCWLWIDQIA
ncbi:hypothetical protein CPter91_1569 [Collimonas pratensis]|uniref:Uncharacterized protein n=1 Tax=Collimonas pratensis TaxID=279113 RepID=A0A127Q1R2_9BURK|nr:hypothetical protein CPter91_1569 [Collimonas pratensis]